MLNLNTIILPILLLSSRAGFGGTAGDAGFGATLGLGLGTGLLEVMLADPTLVPFETGQEV